MLGRLTQLTSLHVWDVHFNVSTLCALCGVGGCAHKPCRHAM
jgi:hypothetical protein